MTRNAHVGSTLESLLEQDGTREEVYAEAVKRVVALQLRQAMKRTRTTVSEMARRMTTSRSQVERVISEQPESVTVTTLAKAARAVGYELDIKLVRSRAATSKRSKKNVRTMSRRVRASAHRTYA